MAPFSQSRTRSSNSAAAGDVSDTETSQTSSGTPGKIAVNVSLAAPNAQPAFTLRIRPDAKLDWLKSAIKRKMGMRKEYQRLLLDGVPLVTDNDEKTLIEVGIADGANLCVQANF